MEKKEKVAKANAVSRMKREVPRIPGYLVVLTWVIFTFL